MNVIRKYRLELGLSQEELAKKLNVERSTIAKWESGTFPRTPKLVLIASVLGCTVDDLLGVKSEVSSPRASKKVTA